MFRRFLSCALAAATVSLFTSSQVAMAADVLTVGSDAPALNVEHWVQDGKGKFKPVTKFDAGKVYVVEFWATWCGPCIASMPHLAETQTKYADKGVQIVSISDEELETVEKFLDGEVRQGRPGPKPKDAAKEDADKKKPTYRDLTSAYCLTTDPDRSSYESYMEAAGQNGIPTAFIVGKDRKIDWIGHPMEMDEPLEQIVAGKWDRKKFADEFKSKQELDLVMQQVSELFQKRDMKGAMKVLDAGIEKAKDSPMAAQLKSIRLQVMMRDKDSVDKLPAALSETLAELKDQPQGVNELVWNVVSGMESGNLPTDKKILEAILPAITAAATQGKGDLKAGTMDTLAHVQFLNGNVDEAIATQKAAIELASDQGKAELGKFLEKLEKAKADK